jgi:hypothetical protein
MSFWSDIRDGAVEGVTLAVLGPLVTEGEAPTGNQTGVQIANGQYGGGDSIASPTAPISYTMNAQGSVGLPGGLGKMTLPMAVLGLGVAWFVFRK